MENYQAGFPWSYANWQSHVQAAKEAAEAAQAAKSGTDLPCKRCWHDLAAHSCTCTKDCGQMPCRHKPTISLTEDFDFPVPVFSPELKVRPTVWTRDSGRGR